MLTSDGSTVTSTTVPELNSTQEEADTRMLLHAQHSSAQYGSILLRCSDTDVLVLCVAHASSIAARIFMQTGGKGPNRILDVSTIAEKLGPQSCSALLGFHAVTGCDSTSSFFRIGKKKTFQLEHLPALVDILLQ